MNNEKLGNDKEELSFYEVFGIRSSYGEIQSAARALKKLLERAVLQSNDTEVSAVIFKVPIEEEEKIEELLHSMKIHPWIETHDGEAVFSIENKRECNRIRFFDFLFATPQEEGLVPEKQTEPVEAPTEQPYEFAFPLPITPDIPHSKVRFTPRLKTPSAETFEEPVEADVWMNKTINDFDQGYPPEEEIIEGAYWKGPDLSLFKNRYRHYKDAVETPTGERLTLDEHKDIILAAKHDPEKMQQAVDMTVGLVKFIVDKIVKKFGTNEIYDEDDLFQAGMEGLIKALKRFEDREGVKPISYLAPSIEGSIRRLIRTQKSILMQPQHIADLVAKYRRAEVELEKKVPTFHSITSQERLMMVGEKMGVPLWEAKMIANRASAFKESFDEHKLDSAFYQSEDVGRGSELEQLKQHASKILTTMNPREDLVLRLRFGILDNSRFLKEEGINELFKESADQHSNLGRKGSVTKLLNFNLETDDFDTYNPAEQMFLAMLGKIPVAWVEHLIHGDYGSAASLQDVGEIFGITGNRARQIEARALRHLKHPLNSRKLRSHLE